MQGKSRRHQRAEELLAAHGQHRHGEKRLVVDSILIEGGELGKAGCSC
jgi:hypothetical protein